MLMKCVAKFHKIHKMQMKCVAKFHKIHKMQMKCVAKFHKIHKMQMKCVAKFKSTLVLDWPLKCSCKYLQSLGFHSALPIKGFPSYIRRRELERKHLAYQGSIYILHDRDSWTLTERERETGRERGGGGCTQWIHSVCEKIYKLTSMRKKC